MLSTSGRILPGASVPICAYGTLTSLCGYFFGGFQKECLRLGNLLALADERSLLPPSVMVPLLFPGLAVGDVLSGAYFLFEVNFFMRSTYTHVGRILLQQRGVDFRPFLTLQPDFMPFTTYIAFPEPTWVSILQRLSKVHVAWVLSNPVR